MITTELRNPESPFHPATQPQGRPRTAPSSHASAFRRIEDRELLQMREVYARHPADVEAYNDGKDAWIKRLEPIAIEWYRQESHAAD